MARFLVARFLVTGFDIGLSAGGGTFAVADSAFSAS